MVTYLTKRDWLQKVEVRKTVERDINVCAKISNFWQRTNTHTPSVSEQTLCLGPCDVSDVFHSIN